VKISTICSAASRVRRRVDGDDAAEGRGRVAGQGPLIGLALAAADGHAAGIGVLDDRHGRALGRVELGDQLEGRVGVVDVVVAELLALQLGRRGHPDAGFGNA
jgi:hypothetical protein